MKNKHPVRIGNAQAFWGDRPDAAATLLKQQPNLDYLTLDYLSEVSMSIMAIQREKDPTAGYARDFLHVIKSLIPFWNQGSKVKVVTNAGGLNPLGCAHACLELLKQCPQIRIGVVSGDDTLSTLKRDAENVLYANLETQQSLKTIRSELITANAYLGAHPIADALKKGADIVITGRVADPSLTVGPCVFHFGWKWDDYDRLAGATIAGHLIECGTQVTGGISNNWLSLHDLAHIGFPFVEIEENGNFIITKPDGSGGEVSVNTVKEQLLYEIGDPKRYLSPDVTVSFLSLKLHEEKKNRIHVSGGIGSAPTHTYKVSGTYQDGFRTEGTLIVCGPEAKKKAILCGKIILQHVEEAGFKLDRSCIETIGAGTIIPDQEDDEAKECLLRIAVADQREEALECFSKEVASMVTSGPSGITGYTTGRPHIRSVFGYWPCLIEKENIEPKVTLL